MIGRVLVKLTLGIIGWLSGFGIMLNVCDWRPMIGRLVRVRVLRLWLIGLSVDVMVRVTCRCVIILPGVWCVNRRRARVR